MHTILGANGVIGEELAKELHASYQGKIKLVGRNPAKVNDTDILEKGDLLDADSVDRVLTGTSIAYLTVGLLYKSEVWLRDWEVVMEHVIDSCIKHKCKLVYFDNTYAYPQSEGTQTEETPMTSQGKKGRGKKKASDLMLQAMAEERIEGVICRAPEFYGPGKTKSFTNNLIFQQIKIGKTPKVFLRDDVLRSLIYTPDASRAMALLAHTSEAYGQVWHLPCDDNRLTYRQIMDEISNQLGRKVNHKVLGAIALKVASLFNETIRETQELFPRYKVDNVFVSDKFKSRFPDFQVTSYQEGIRQILKDYQLS